MRREISELVSSSFQEIFNWEKAWQSKNNNQNNAFCLPFFGFFTKSSQYQIWKANPYSILTNGNQAWTARLESLTRISKFYDPSDSEHKFHKMRIENWLSVDFKLASLWLQTYSSHNHYTMFNLQYDGES